MKRRNVLTVLIVLLCSAATLWAAGAKEPAATTASTSENEFLSDTAGLTDGAFLEGVPTPTQDWEIANITRTLMNAHWVKNKEGFEAAGKHYGVTANVLAVESEQDVMDQLNILDTCIERGYDAVLVSPITEQNLIPGLQKATAAGIVIINVDTAEISVQSADENGINIASRIGSDNYDSGRMVAEFMSELLGEKGGKVAIVEGNPGDTCAIARTSGFTDYANSSSNLNLVASQTGRWDRLQALEVTTSMLRANPDIVGIYCNNDTMVLGAMQAAADLGYEILTSDDFDRAGEAKTLLLVGNDGIPEAIEAVQTGALTGTIAQKPYLMGYAGLEAAIMVLEGVTPPETVHTPVALLTKADF